MTCSRLQYTKQTDNTTNFTFVFHSGKINNHRFFADVDLVEMKLYNPVKVLLEMLTYLVKP